jgi:DNA-directed RNA polymerase specialized sigma24 family protein
LSSSDEIESRNERRARRAERFKATPLPRKDLPPELLALPEEELRLACEALREIALKVNRRVEDAEDLYWSVWDKVRTTRRYDPAKGPLEPWLILIAKSVFSNAREKEALDAEHDATAADGYTREERPLVVASAEDDALAHAEREREKAEATDDLETLRARAAKHPIALQVLDMMADDLPPKEIAERLGVPPKKVYEASDSLRDYVKEIREARRRARQRDERNERDERDERDEKT